MGAISTGLTYIHSTLCGKQWEPSGLTYIHSTLCGKEWEPSGLTYIAHCGGWEGVGAISTGLTYIHSTLCGKEWEPSGLTYIAHCGGWEGVGAIRADLHTQHTVGVGSSGSHQHRAVAAASRCNRWTAYMLESLAQHGQGKPEAIRKITIRTMYLKTAECSLLMLTAWSELCACGYRITKKKSVEYAVHLY